MKPKKVVRKIEFQLCSMPDSEGLVLEFLDENEEAFMEIRANQDDTHQVILYQSDEHISILLSDLLKGVEIAKEKVFNVRLAD